MIVDQARLSSGAVAARIDPGKASLGLRQSIGFVFLLAGPVALAAQEPAAVAPSEPAAAGEAASDPKLDSERKMHEVLARIAKDSEENHPFVGVGAARRWRAQLAALPKDAPPLERWRIAHELGLAEMRLGRFQEAIDALAISHDQLPKLKSQITEKDARQTLNDAAMAWLRLGETQNCVARHTSQSCILPIGPQGVHVNQTAARKSIEGFLETLKYFPDDPVARWLLNLASMTVGEWPNGVPERWRIPASVFDSAQPFPHFEDIAPSLALNHFNLSGGSVIDDFDGDQLLDILTSSWDTRVAMVYHKNNGDGTFTERSAEANFKEELGGINFIQGDYDNDGDLDLYVMRGAWLLEYGKHPDSLLENDGHGTFTDVTYFVGLAEPFYPTHSAAFADFDLDGDLDLFVGNESRPEDPNPSQLYRNDGGHFVDIAPQAGVTNLRYAKGVTWGDFDGDRDPDLFVSNLFEENRLYRNNGDGTFTDIAPELKMTTPLASFPAWWWDFDNDGALDLYVSSWERDVSKYVRSLLHLPFKGEACRLWKNDGKGNFKDVAPEQGLTLLVQPMGANFGDLDGDGWLDFYLGTGYPEYEALMPKAMYRNREGRGFADVTTAGGFGHLQKGHGISFADLDQDGDVDVHEEMGGAFAGDGFGNVLYENPGFGNRWIKVQLVGREENRCAIGARICVTVVDRAEGGEKTATRRIFRTVNSGASFGSNPLRQDIGLGKPERIEKLEVFWPRTGRTETFTEVPLDCGFRITEGTGSLERLELPRFAFRRT
jgi:VCBS repeat protein/ASPIC/UnbV protein